MLALTDSAVEAVRGIVSSSEQASETGGLRIAAEPMAGAVSFQLSVVALPGEDDEVVEDHGARLFLDQEAATVLYGKVLDARIEQNQVEFMLADHAA